jgi:hypothetical protein
MSKEGFHAQKMRYLILNKLTEVGATSEDNAVTPDDADLTLPERGWLNYLAGGLISRIRKTSDGRYYLSR